jgi:paired amphipathic helix protein Sin3a
MNDHRNAAYLLHNFLTFSKLHQEALMAVENVTIDHEEAVDFVRKVQKRINKEAYKDFLMTLCAYRNKWKDVADVYRDVVELFADYPDLLEGFHRFLPTSEVIADLESQLQIL